MDLPKPLYHVTNVFCRCSLRSLLHHKHMYLNKEAMIPEASPVLSGLGPKDGRQISLKHSLFKHICSWPELVTMNRCYLAWYLAS